ncbi:hypothetical protein K2X05_07475 [bacterium]|nr:hypothetical protein [bacterium]
MTTKSNKYIIYSIIALAIFGFLGVVGLTLFFASSISKDVSFHEWISASKKFSDDAVEIDKKVTFQTLPSDKELSDFFKLHQKEFDLMNTMFLEDKISSLNALFAFDKDNRMAMYPYIEKLDFGKDAGKAVFSIARKRYDKYRELMKSCKVEEIHSLDEENEDCVGFTMYNESLVPGKDTEDAEFFKRKGVSYWKNADFDSYQSTDEIKPVDGAIYGSVEIEPKSHWFVWLWVQLPDKK